MGWYYDFKPYVPVAQRRANAAREMSNRSKSGKSAEPVKIAGRKITTTFWGDAWCTNLESYSDFANRLPRGRTYARNGSVVDLKIKKGLIEACVSGSELYDIEVVIKPLAKAAWQTLKKDCVGQIGSLVELLQGRLSNAVMERVTDLQSGLFPKPKEIEMNCSCPDYAGMCKHIAAVMYGVGNRLDQSPELLFLLRAVNHQEIIDEAVPAAPKKIKTATPVIAAEDLGAVFEIDLGETEVAVKPKANKPAKKKALPKKG